MRSQLRTGLGIVAMAMAMATAGCAPGDDEREVAVTSSALTSSAAPSEARYSWRNVEIVGGGYVPGIVFNSREPGLAYARTDIGGAYRWQASAEHWVPLLDELGWDDWNLTGVDSIATDPVDPDRVYVLAGTYTNWWASTNAAVLRSKDRGRTWQRTDLPFKGGGNMPGRNMGERLSIDPNDHRIIYLGARSGNGLWRSGDFGRTWSQVSSFPAGGTYVQDPNDPNGYLSDPIGVVWIVFDPTTGACDQPTQTIYVGVADLGVSVYRSTDGGTTWAPLRGQPSGLMPHHGVLASTGVLYLAYNNKGGPFDGESGDVWKYDTATGAWTRITPGPVAGDSVFGYGGLAVDAQHPDTVMVAALNSWWPDTIIWRSTDAGASWTRIWDWGSGSERTLHYTQDISAAPWLTFGRPTALPVVSPPLGWMVGDLEIDPFDSNHFVYGTGATVYGSHDLTNWDLGAPIDIAVEAQGIEETAVLDLISPPQGPPLVSALGDVGGFRHDDPSVVPSSMFVGPTFITTTSLDYAGLTPSVMVRVGTGADPAARNAAVSRDGGATWSDLGGQPAAAGTVAVSADGARIVWSPANAAVVFSNDDGLSWSASAGVPATARIASDRVDGSRFYAFAGGAFFASVDGGATFTASTAAGLPVGAAVQIKAVPDHSGQVWLAGGAPWTSYGLWFSQDSGNTFAKVDGVDQADTVGFGKAAPGRSYPAIYTSAQIAGTRGIFRSDDGGGSWLRINDDQHQYGMTNTAITGDPRVYGRVYIGTNGRGIVYGDQRRPPRQ